MKTTKDFSTETKTITGIPVKDIRFNGAVNMWLGMVYDNKSYLPDKWTTITWKPNGKCINRRRPELDLS